MLLDWIQYLEEKGLLQDIPPPEGLLERGEERRQARPGGGPPGVGGLPPIVSGLCDNNGPQEGKPNVDEVVMVKFLLQSWYGLSGPELEHQMDDRPSFQRFLGFTEKVPDYSTVWSFREHLAETGWDQALWEELQRQIDEKGLKVRKGLV